MGKFFGLVSLLSVIRVETYFMGVRLILIYSSSLGLLNTVY